MPQSNKRTLSVSKASPTTPPIDDTNSTPQSLEDCMSVDLRAIVPDESTFYISAVEAYIASQVAAAEKAKDNAYWERNQLVAFLTKLYPSWIGYHDGEDWEDDWRTIIYIKTPAGQLSWHIHDGDKKYFTHLDPGLEEWDGHTTEEKYQRLAQLSKEKTP